MESPEPGLDQVRVKEPEKLRDMRGGVGGDSMHCVLVEGSN